MLLIDEAMMLVRSLRFVLSHATLVLRKSIYSPCSRHESVNIMSTFTEEKHDESLSMTVYLTARTRPNVCDSTSLWKPRIHQVPTTRNQRSLLV